MEGSIVVGENRSPTVMCFLFIITMISVLAGARSKRRIYCNDLTVVILLSTENELWKDRHHCSASLPLFCLCTNIPKHSAHRRNILFIAELDVLPRVHLLCSCRIHYTLRVCFIHCQ